MSNNILVVDDAAFMRMMIKDILITPAHAYGMTVLLILLIRVKYWD